MDRVIKWSIVITASYFAIACIATILFFKVSDFSLVVPTNTDPTVQILLLISGTIAGILAVRLFAIYRARHHNVTQILLFMFLCDGAAAIVEVIRGFIRFGHPDFNRLMSNSFFFILCLGSFLAAYFVGEVFYEGLSLRKNKVRLAKVSVALGLFLGGIVKEVFIPSDTLEVAIFGVILLLTELYVYTSLTLAAFLQSRRLSDPAAKQGFRLIGLGGVSLITYFSCLFAFYVAKTIDTIAALVALNWIAQAFLVASMLLLYIGLTYPMKSRPSPSIPEK